MTTEFFLGNNGLIDEFKKALLKVQKGQGSIITVSGDTGMGKSALLMHLDGLTALEKNTLSAFSRAANPIGKLKVGNLQPLLPFSKAIEILMEGPKQTAKKRFAINVGMTLLASIPGPDILFYAIKEIGKDWRQFKKEKSSDSTKKVSSATADFYDTINSICDKTPSVMLLDDMHWADAQSVELLNLFAENIENIPIILVLAYKESMLESASLPIVSFLNYKRNKDIVKHFELEKFTPQNVSIAAKTLLNSYLPNLEFEKWLYEKSQGNPLSVVEYLKYFSTHSPFDERGAFLPNMPGNEALPASIQGIISEKLEHLDDDDKNILAVCSSEGAEFTIAIVSKLLNTDVLTTIRKLRSIQNRTGVIRSLGASFKYGEKTTVYKFTQAYYHSFFEKTLEYEEYTALHSRISSILKEKYDQTQFSEVKDQLTPYIAAHSAEAGDAETAESMMLLSAESAGKFGNPDVVKDLYQDFILMSKTYKNDEDNTQNEEFKRIIENTSNSFDRATPDVYSNDGNGMPISSNYTDFNFATTFNNLTEMFLSEKYDEALIHIREIKDNFNEKLLGAELAKLELLQVKISLEKGELDTAIAKLEQIRESIDRLGDAESLCFYYNLRAIASSENGNTAEVQFYLSNAAEAAVGLSPEMRLLTLSNISIITGDKNGIHGRKYYQAAKKLAYELNMTDLLNDLNESFD